MLSSFLAVTLAMARVCVHIQVDENHVWQKVASEVVPVVQSMQKSSFERLGNADFVRVNFETALSLVGTALSDRRNYYVVRAGYWGKKDAIEEMPEKLSMGVDIDSEGTAFVVSFRITADAYPIEAAAILATDADVRNVVTGCMSIQ